CAARARAAQRGRRGPRPCRARRRRWPPTAWRHHARGARPRRRRRAPACARAPGGAGAGRAARPWCRRPARGRTRPAPDRRRRAAAPCAPFLRVRKMTTAFPWQEGERRIGFGRGALADAPALLGDGYTLLTTERAAEAAPGIVAAAGNVIRVAAGRVDDLAGDL